MKKLFNLAATHKFISTVVAIVVLFAAYQGYARFYGAGTVSARYVLQTVQKGTLVSSVSGTGQISASTQFDVKPNVSGDVIGIGVVEGQKVNAGDLLVRLDSTDAQKTVRDAELNLQSAQLSLQQLQLSSANVQKLLNDAFASISNTFLDFPTIVNDAYQVLLSDDLNPKNQTNSDYYRNFIPQIDDTNFKENSLLIDSANFDYLVAKSDYDTAFLLYKNTSRYADEASVRKLLESTIKSADSLAQALKSEQNILDFLTDYVSSGNNSRKLPTIITTYKNTLKNDIGLTNTRLSELTAIYNSIQNAPLDVQAQELSIKQRGNALADAKANLAYYYIGAPFGGVVAKLNVKIGDAASPSTVVATMINFEKLAEITLNEVDVSKVKTGQKATLTFDALPDLTLTGKVVRVDTIGTVTQGVVNYSVKIALETDDARIKPGMSVSAAIVTDVKSDVLLVPNSAVKSSGNNYYVQVVDVKTNSSSTAAGEITPRQVIVQTGLSNDAMTEITNGLKEGDVVVTQTITQTASQNQSQQSSGIRIPGITTGGGGGGVLRVGGGGGGGAEAPH